MKHFAAFGGDVNGRGRCLAAACVLLLVAAGAWSRFGVAQEGDPDVRYAEVMPLAPHSLVLDGTAADFGGVAVGERGHVLISDDFSEWRQAEPVPTRATLTAVQFLGRHGWAVGHDAVILYSDDSGESWHRQFHAPEREQPLLDVLFLDSLRGYAIGAYDLILRTDDGGETWRVLGGVDDLDDWHLNSILRTDDGTIYIAAEQGIVYRYDDETRSWETLQLPYQGSMFGLLETAPDEVLVFGLRGRAFQTDDGGQSWTPVDTDTDSSLFGGSVLKDDTVVLVGNNGTITSRAPGGAFQARQHREGEPLAGVIEAPDGTLVYFGVNGIGTDASATGAQ